MEYKFKKSLSLPERMNQCHSLLIKNPSRIPVILEKDPLSKVSDIQKSKFLIQKDITVNQFIKMIRGLMEIGENEALFFVVKGKYSISGEKTMGQIYNNYKDKEDGFLYITYSSEIFFG